jgi:glutamyl-tRNA synthetase
MYRAFGWEPPVFCHLPMVMGQDGKKLSKRHGATSIDEFRRQGYLCDALINYIALLGASYEEGKDIFSLKDLAEHFSLDKLNKAPAIFDYKKLEWYNGQYIRMKSDQELADLCMPWAIDAGLFGTDSTEKTKPTAEQLSLFIKAMPLIKERLVFLHEAPGKIAYLFSCPQLPLIEEFIPKKADLNQTIELMRLGKNLIQEMANAADDESAEKLIKEAAEKNSVKLGDLMMPLRVAITGSRISPPLFGSLRLLGAKQSFERVDTALKLLESKV